MTYRVVFAPEAVEQLAALYRYIAQQASPNIASSYTDAVVGYCESLARFPQRGTRRDDIRSGLRVTHYRSRTVIAFAVDDKQVSILGVFYGGQNYISALREEMEDKDTG